VGKKLPQLVVLEDEQYSLHHQFIPSFSGSKIISFLCPEHGEKLALSIFYGEDGKLTQEKWKFIRLSAISYPPVRAQEEVRIAPPPRVSPSLSLVWASHGFHNIKKFSKKAIPAITIKSPGETDKLLYEIWAQRTLLEGYGKAMGFHQNKEYAEAVRHCLNILQIMPDHPEISKLLGETALEMLPELAKKEFKSDIVSRLEKTIVKTPLSNISIEQFFQILSDATGVCFEMDISLSAELPARSQKMEDLPAGESAISLLNYVLGKKKWAYKIEHGVVCITSSSKGLSKSLLAELDKAVNEQISSLPGDKSVKQKQANLAHKIWLYSGPATKSGFSVKFPSPGIWMVNSHHLSPHGEIQAIRLPMLVLP
jgi:hypothetical protein